MVLRVVHAHTFFLSDFRTAKLLAHETTRDVYVRNVCVGELPLRCIAVFLFLLSVPNVL